MKYEYKVVEALFGEIEGILGDLGPKGWELVSVVPFNQAERELYFKRSLKGKTEYPITGISIPEFLVS